MKLRRVYSTPSVELAQQVLQAARAAGIDNDGLSLIARSDIELQAVPDERKEAKTDFLPAAARGAATGGAAGLVAGLVAVAVPPIGLTIAGVGVMALAGALVGSWSSALVGATVPDPVRRQFEAEIEAGRVLVVLDADETALQAAEPAVQSAGGTPLPYEAASAAT
ncbi:hypothetical protein [Xanthomonas maliensis]|uniref:hypothetical protein n=1 Tax=Xanthomonas maliensis TaxID=1321368 RepID=UPI0003A4D0C2|nr:hypothetical protein [Xanthomonas maliensis]KAB7768058.1 hypothetical protein CKY51_10200 [Xanthomonas maliensis]